MTSRVGILFAVLPLLALSCGERSPTEPTSLAVEVPAVPVYDAFYNPVDILTVWREILVDSRVTQIEWDAAGAGNFVLMKGVDGGGDFYANLRAEWTRDKFEDPIALQLLVQWPDFSENRLDHPIVNDSIDVADDLGRPLLDCNTDDRIVRPTSWHRSDDLEDQVEVEIFPSPSGGFPSDNWRWGAGTTDPATPVSPVDFTISNHDSVGAFAHGQAGFCEDRWNTGSGVVSDAGKVTYEPNYVTYPNGVLPIWVAGKSTRDARLNRSKPVAYSIWRSVATPLTRCTVEDPVRVDDAAQRDKSWNPGDYVPGWTIGLAIPDTSFSLNTSSADVIARGAWQEGKWGVEIRRRLNTGHPEDDLTIIPPDPKNPNAAATVYGIRLTIRDGQTRKTSRSAIVPLILRPAAPK